MSNPRFQRTIDLRKSNNNPLNGLSAESQLTVLKKFKQQALLEGAIDELERSRPVIDAAYYIIRKAHLTTQLAKLKSAKKENRTRVVELHFVG